MSGQSGATNGATPAHAAPPAAGQHDQQQQKPATAPPAKNVPIPNPQVPISTKSSSLSGSQVPTQPSMVKVANPPTAAPIPTPVPVPTTQIQQPRVAPVPQSQHPTQVQANVLPGTYPPGTHISVGSHKVEVVKYIAEGGFAQIYTVKFLSRVAEYAATPGATSQNQLPLQPGEVACLKRVLVKDDNGLNEMRNEVNVMQKLKGAPCVVQYYDSNASHRADGSPGYEVLLLMELCPNNSLLDYMNDRLQTRLNEKEILRIMHDTTLGIAQLHYLKTPLIHRDIKIENVLVDKDNNFKLCDFGSTSICFPVVTNHRDIAIFTQNIYVNTTPQYRAPEMIDLYRYQPIDEKSDIWALGVFLYKLLFYTTPFERTGQFAILHSKYEFPKNNYSSKFINLIIIMLAENPSIRPNIFQVLEYICTIMGWKVPIHDKYGLGPYNFSEYSNFQNNIQNIQSQIFTLNQKATQNKGLLAPADHNILKDLYTRYLEVVPKIPIPHQMPQVLPNNAPQSHHPHGVPTAQQPNPVQQFVPGQPQMPSQPVLQQSPQNQAVQLNLQPQPQIANQKNPLPALSINPSTSAVHQVAINNGMPVPSSALHNKTHIFPVVQGVGAQHAPQPVAIPQVASPALGVSQVYNGATGATQLNKSQPPPSLPQVPPPIKSPTTQLSSKSSTQGLLSGVSKQSSLNGNNTISSTASPAPDSVTLNTSSPPSIPRNQFNDVMSPSTDQDIKNQLNLKSDLGTSQSLPIPPQSNSTISSANIDNQLYQTESGIDLDTTVSGKKQHKSTNPFPKMASPTLSHTNSNALNTTPSNVISQYSGDDQSFISSSSSSQFNKFSGVALRHVISNEQGAQKHMSLNSQTFYDAPTLDPKLSQNKRVSYADPGNDRMNSTNNTVPSAPPVPKAPAPKAPASKAPQREPIEIDISDFVSPQTESKIPPVPQETPYSPTVSTTKVKVDAEESTAKNTVPPLPNMRPPIPGKKIEHPVHDTSSPEIMEFLKDENNSNVSKLSELVKNRIIQDSAHPPHIQGVPESTSYHSIQSDVPITSNHHAQFDELNDKDGSISSSSEDTDINIGHSATSEVNLQNIQNQPPRNGVLAAATLHSHFEEDEAPIIHGTQDNPQSISSSSSEEEDFSHMTTATQAN